MARLKLSLWVVLVIGLGVLYHNYFRGEDVDMAEPELNDQMVQIEATPVKVDTAFVGELIKYVHATGFTEPIRQAKIISRVNGRIKRLPVIEGQWVRKGERLVQIDDELLQIELAEARSNLLKAQVEYALWQREVASFSRDSLSRQELQQLALTYRQAREKYQRGEIEELQLLTIERRYRIAQILSGELREEIIAEKSGLKAAEMRYARALYNVRNSRINAPFAGQVADIQVSEGAYVTQNQELMTLVDLSRVKIKLQVMESQLNRIQTGEVLEVRFAAFPDTFFTGKIVGIDPTIDPRERTVTVVAILPNNHGLLKAGMFGEARLAVGRFSDRLLVPRNAVIVRDQRKLVFIVRQGKAVWCYVRTGEENEDYIEIVSSDFDLKPGEPVIVDGQFALAHDAPVKVIGSENRK
ncbi:MAG: efflux RND transporter periplasmic adaptor subunit [Calditrichaeota bacterium]|nr:efflux RND transporter periplasmic adaptor subunit [Calditrichota bacterium]